MRPEVRILGGLALITVGAAGLIAMNLWTVPTIAQGRPPPVEPVATTPAVTPDRTPSPRATPVIPSGVAEAGAAKQVDAALEAAAQPAADDSSTTTSRSTDGTTFPSIRFAPESRAASKEMIKDVEPIAAYLRNHFGMKVLLVGHGDAGTDAAEYVRVGRLRAAAVLRMLVDYGVSVARIGIEMPRVEGDRVMTGGVPPGTVELRIEPRFQQPKKGQGDGP